MKNMSNLNVNMFENRCRCIKETKVDKIVVGNIYRYSRELSTFKIMYDITDKTFQVLPVSKAWFEEHFKVE